MISMDSVENDQRCFLEGKDLIGDILIFHWTRSMGGRVVHLTVGKVKTWDLYQDERNDNREQ